MIFNLGLGYSQEDGGKCFAGRCSLGTVILCLLVSVREIVNGERALIFVTVYCVNQAARAAEGESKQKFFTQDINGILLE